MQEKNKIKEFPEHLKEQLPSGILLWMEFFEWMRKRQNDKHGDC
jgi:hypothetical protein